MIYFNYHQVLVLIFFFLTIAGLDLESNEYDIPTSINQSPVNSPKFSRKEMKVKFTYYWIAVESEFPLKSGRPTTEIRTCNGTTIKKVSKAYQQQVKMEGSGYLSTGQFVNCADDKCNCFQLVDGPKGSDNNSLNPYISVAANDLAFGSSLFVKELNGTKLPSTNQIHNGCVRVEDRSWSFGGNHIDWFVFDHRYYEALEGYLNLDKVTILVNATCQLLNYSLPYNTSIPSTAFKKRPHYYSIPLVGLLLPFY